MLINVLLWVFGGVLLLLGIIKTVIYINKDKEFKGYKITKGCVVELPSTIKSSDEGFGYEAINYDEDDPVFLAEEEISTNAIIVEFIVKNKKYRIIDPEGDVNLMPVGKEVMIKYNPQKPKDAFVAEDFDGIVLYVVGTFLILVGVFTYLYM